MDVIGAPNLPALAFVVAARSEEDWVPPELIDEVERRTAVRGSASDPAMKPRVFRHNGVVLADCVSPGRALAVLEFVARDPELVAGLWLAAPNQLRGSSLRLAARARLRHTRICVHSSPDAALAKTAAALIDLHVSLVRRRTIAQQRVAEVHRLHGSVTATARALGCSHQAVGQALARCSYEATAQTSDAFRTLFEIAPVRERPAGARWRIPPANR